MPDSIFNEPVTGDAVLSDSATLVNNLVAQADDSYGEVGVNFNRPVYEASASTPDVTMSVASGCNSFTANTGTEVPIPAGAAAGDSSDEILTVYQPSSNTEWEFWLAQKTSTGWEACWGGKLDMATSDGVFPGGYGETATGIANLATEITQADIASGSIDHAIAIQVQDCNNYVAPADRTDCSTNDGDPAEGQYFRFAPGTPMPAGLTPFGQMVFKAGLTYGFVVVDQGGGVELEADETGSWAINGNSGTDPIDTSMDGEQEYQVVASLPWNDLQAISPPQS